MDLWDGTQSMPCGKGCGGPSENAVYVYTMDTLPFKKAEAYHQFQCNFSRSTGIPYPPLYWRDLYHHMRDSGRVTLTGYLETGTGTLSHPGALCLACYLLLRATSRGDGDGGWGGART